HLDAATCSMGGDDQQAVAVLRGTADGGFEPPVSYPVSYSPDLSGTVALTSGDVDGDDDLDLLSVNYGSNDVSLLENNGDGTFQSHVRFGAGPTPTDIYYGDFTGDEIGDMAVVIGLPPSNLPGAVAIVEGLSPAPSSVEWDARRPDMRLSLAGPSPFAGRTALAYRMPEPGSVRLTIHDVLGRRVAVLRSGYVAEGVHRVAWNGRNGRGLPVSPGVYFARLRALESSSTVRLLVVE
ncbi:MAG: hypothetical protein GF355_14110, partial [Candidatus Eisenbacteria bacterium]|nr:hypothetical protein [Candidatus Eisenbacteria bacterium]